MRRVVLLYSPGTAFLEMGGPERDDGNYVRDEGLERASARKLHSQRVVQSSFPGIGGLEGQGFSVSQSSLLNA